MVTVKVGHDVINSAKFRTADIAITENITFDGLLLSENVLKGLNDSGFHRPSPIQLKSIPLGRCGLDLIVQAKAGTGKTCVFTVIALEAIQLDSPAVQVLVLAPTREIAFQIWQVMTSIGSAMEDLKCAAFIGGMSVTDDKYNLKKCHIVVGTPGRIKFLLEQRYLKTKSIRLFVLDEADQLLDEKFQADINWIYSVLPENKQMLALSATYPEYLAKQLKYYMRNPTFIRLNTTQLALLGIRQYYLKIPYHPLVQRAAEYSAEAAIRILSTVAFNQCLIFSNLQSGAQSLASQLEEQGWPTCCIAGSLDQRDRNEAMASLKAFQCRVLISTDLTSRGIDAENVDLVINLDLPKNPRVYLHRIGRAGRFGSHGAAITLISGDIGMKELKMVEAICNTSLKPLDDPIPQELISRKVPSSEVSLDDLVHTETIDTSQEKTLNGVVKEYDTTSKKQRRNKKKDNSKTCSVANTVSVSSSVTGEDLEFYPGTMQAVNGVDHESASESCLEISDSNNVSLIKEKTTNVCSNIKVSPEIVVNNIGRNECTSPTDISVCDEDLDNSTYTVTDCNSLQETTSNMSCKSLEHKSSISNALPPESFKCLKLQPLSSESNDSVDKIVPSSWTCGKIPEHKSTKKTSEYYQISENIELSNIDSQLKRKDVKSLMPANTLSHPEQILPIIPSPWTWGTVPGYKGTMKISDYSQVCKEFESFNIDSQLKCKGVESLMPAGILSRPEQMLPVVNVGKLLDLYYKKISTVMIKSICDRQNSIPGGGPLISDIIKYSETRSSDVASNACTRQSTPPNTDADPPQVVENTSLKDTDEKIKMQPNIITSSIHCCPGSSATVNSKATANSVTLEKKSLPVNKDKCVKNSEEGTNEMRAIKRSTENAQLPNNWKELEASQRSCDPVHESRNLANLRLNPAMSNGMPISTAGLKEESVSSTGETLPYEEEEDEVLTDDSDSFIPLSSASDTDAFYSDSDSSSSEEESSEHTNSSSFGHDPASPWQSLVGFPLMYYNQTPPYGMWGIRLPSPMGMLPPSPPPSQWAPVDPRSMFMPMSPYYIPLHQLPMNSPNHIFPVHQIPYSYIQQQTAYIQWMLNSNSQN